jgi:hypothetical protein
MERQVTDEQREGVLKKARTTECGRRRLVFAWSGPQEASALKDELERLKKLEA